MNLPIIAASGSCPVLDGKSGNVFDSGSVRQWEAQRLKGLTGDIYSNTHANTRLTKECRNLQVFAKELQEGADNEEAKKRQQYARL